MKLYCRGEYHNQPAGLHFDTAGVIELDAAKAEFLLRDAPENFARYEEFPQVQVLEGAPPPSAGDGDSPHASDETKQGEGEDKSESDDEEEAGANEKALDAPKRDKQVKAPAKKK